MTRALSEQNKHLFCAYANHAQPQTNQATETYTLVNCAVVGRGSSVVALGEQIGECSLNCVRDRPSIVFKQSILLHGNWCGHYHNPVDNWARISRDTRRPKKKKLAKTETRREKKVQEI